MGFSPSVRLFEAAACGVPIISDRWPGLETIFVPGKHILVARSSQEVLSYIREFPNPERRRLANRARELVLARHTAAHRAVALEGYVEEALGRSTPRRVAAAG
jgi:spore maturation protein CgeB